MTVPVASCAGSWARVLLEGREEWGRQGGRGLGGEQVSVTVRTCQRGRCQSGGRAIFIAKCGIIVIGKGGILPVSELSCYYETPSGHSLKRVSHPPT